MPINPDDKALLIKALNSYHESLEMQWTWAMRLNHAWLDMPEAELAQARIEAVKDLKRRLSTASTSEIECSVRRTSWSGPRAWLSSLAKAVSSLRCGSKQ